MKNTDEILEIFPCKIKKELYDYFIKNNKILNEMQEIRIRVNRPISIKTRKKDYFMNNRISQNEILYILERICQNSIYAYKIITYLSKCKFFSISQNNSCPFLIAMRFQM